MQHGVWYKMYLIPAPKNPCINNKALILFRKLGILVLQMLDDLNQAIIAANICIEYLQCMEMSQAMYGIKEFIIFDML